MRPHAGQARQEILELRQLDLQLCFVAARAGREDVENDFGAIHDAHAQTLLELDALHRRQTLIEQQERRAGRRQLVLQRFDLALAEVKVGSRRIDALDRAADDFSPGGIRQPFQLVEMLIDMYRVIRSFTRSTDKKRLFHGRLDINQLSNDPSSSLRRMIIEVVSGAAPSPYYSTVPFDHQPVCPGAQPR